MATWNATRVMGASGNRTARVVACAKGYDFQGLDILNPAASVPRQARNAEDSGLQDTWSRDFGEPGGEKGLEVEVKVNADNQSSVIDGMEPGLHSEGASKEHPDRIRNRVGNMRNHYRHSTRDRNLNDGGKGGRGTGNQGAGKQGNRTGGRFKDHHKTRRRHGSMSNGRPGVWDLPGVELAAAAAERQRTRVRLSRSGSLSGGDRAKSDRGKEMRATREAQPQKFGSGTGARDRPFDVRKIGQQHTHVGSTVRNRHTGLGDRTGSKNQQHAPGRGQRQAQGGVGKWMDRGGERRGRESRSDSLRRSRSLDSASSKRRPQLSFRQDRWQHAMANYRCLDRKLRQFEHFEKLMEDGTPGAPADAIYSVLAGPTNAKADDLLDRLHSTQRMHFDGQRTASSVPRSEKDNPWWFGDDDVTESLHMYETEYAHFISDDGTPFVGSRPGRATDVDSSDWRLGHHPEPNDSLTGELDALLDVIEGTTNPSAGQIQFSGEPWPMDGSVPVPPDQFVQPRNGNRIQGQSMAVEPQPDVWPVDPAELGQYPADDADMDIYGRILLHSFSPMGQNIPQTAWSLVGVQMHLHTNGPPQVPQMRRHVGCGGYDEERLLMMLNVTEYKLATPRD